MLETPIASPLLIGREREMRTLEGLLQEARHGRGSMAVISGDAGIGKTRLAREIKAVAAQRQMRVIEGRCTASEMGVPYAPFMDALRFRLARGESDAAAQVLQPILAHVAPLFAGLGEAASGEAGNAGATAAPFEPIYSAICRLAGLGPILFIVEDIQWADATSRDLLQYIARRLRALPMLLVATCRGDDGYTPDSTQSLVSTLVRERAAVRLSLDPLGRPGVEAMLAAALGTAFDAELAVIVHDRTEGNPLFVEEYISAFLNAGLETGPANLVTPPTLRDVVWERLSRLTPEARAALSVAAVIGRRFRFDVLAAALGWPEERLLRAIEELTAQGIVVEHTDPVEESYSFRQNLVQEVLYGSTIGRRRRLLHGQVANALETSGAKGGLPHTMLAHHYGLAGDPQRARVHGVLAGDEAARLCAWKDAQALYETALAALEREGGDANVEAEILERMADVAWWQNRLDAFDQYLLSALAIRRALHQPNHAATLLRRLANMAAYQRGDIERAMQMLNEALVLVKAENSAEHVFVLNDLGRLQVRNGEWEEANRLFERSLGASAARGDCAEEALSLVMLGWLSVHRGDIPAGCERLELARALLNEENLPIDRGAEVYHAGIRALVAAREHRRAREWVEAALAYAREHGAQGDLAIYRAYQAAVQRRMGAWDAALSGVLHAAAELRASGRAELREALRILGDVQRVSGDLTSARASYREAIALGEHDAVIGEALVLLAEEKAEEAGLRLAVALKEQPAADRLFALRVIPLLVEARAAAGALEQARTDLRRMRALVSTCAYVPGKAALAQAAGILYAVTGESVRAVRELRRAVKTWQQLELPYEAARALLLLAGELVKLPRGQQEAVDLARQAAAAFERLGAAHDVARAHHVLRRAGVNIKRQRRRSPLPAPLDRLTAREAEVYFELARGATNKQIARTLSMSPRTAGNHVSAILSKLECATRTEAARFAQSGVRQV